MSFVYDYRYFTVPIILNKKKNEKITISHASQYKGYKYLHMFLDGIFQSIKGVP